MKRYLFVLVLLVLTHVVYSQGVTVNGTVLSEADMLGLPGLSVLIKGSTQGTITNLAGEYVLQNVKPADTLIFRYVGFITREIHVGNQRNIDVIMQEDTQELQEIVVTALGVKRQRREIGYSTEKIDAEVVSRSNSPNVISSITGRSAGVLVANNDGVEGGSNRITIRGNNNLASNNQPLIIVDGIPMENIPGLTSIGRGVDWGSPIGDINALDIEDFSVLKGGAASALYGSRGANGVIIITTKRGKHKKGLGLTYNFSHKIIQPYRFRDVQNVYGHGGPVSLTPPTFPLNESGDTLLYPGIYGTENLILNQEGETSSSTEQFGNYGSSVSWGPKMEGQLVKWWDGEMRPYSPQPNNLKLPFRDGYTRTHNIAVTGGNDKGSLRVSLTRTDHQPIIYNSAYDRTTINLGANLKASSKLTTDLTVNYVDYNRLNSPMIGEDVNSFSKGLLYDWPRSYKGLDFSNYELSDGSRNLQENYPFVYVDDFLWWNYFNNNTELRRDKFYGALSLIYDVSSWFNITARTGLDFTMDQYEIKNKPTDVLGIMNGYYSSSLSRNYSENFDIMGTLYKDQLMDSDFSVSVTAGASRWNKDYYSIGAHSGLWAYPNMYTFFNYTENTYMNLEAYDSVYTVVDDWGNSVEAMAASEHIIQRRTNSIFSFFDISYKNYLYLQLTGRNDWSSTLPPEYNSYFYPSASLSFIASEAYNFSERIPWLNFLKLRAGASQTASDTDPYQTEFYYRTGIFGGVQTSFLPDTIPPISLKPQRVNAYEGGVNMGFLDNRIDLDFTYYYLYSFDQILAAPLPSSAGAPYILINEGALKNYGFEIILNTVPVHTKSFVIRSSLNFARNRNYIVSLGEYADQFHLADIWGLNGPAMILREGDEYGTISGYDYVYHENGQPIVNDEGTEYLITETRVPIGNASPDFIAGWNTNFSYKNFSLNLLIDTKWGGDIYCGSYVIGLQTGQSPETLLEREGGGLPYTDPDGNVSNTGVILDGVYEDGTPNDKVVHYYYKYLPNAGGWGLVISTPGIIENTWVKMREIGLTYHFSPQWISQSNVFQTLSLSVVGRNLFYIYTTLPDHINPEGIMGSGNAQGFEWASFPGTRAITFNINAGF